MRLSSDTECIGIMIKAGKSFASETSFTLFDTLIYPHIWYGIQ